MTQINPDDSSYLVLFIGFILASILFIFCLPITIFFQIKKLFKKRYLKLFLITLIFLSIVYAVGEVYQESHGVSMSNNYGTAADYGNCFINNTVVGSWQLDSVKITASEGSTRCNVLNATDGTELATWVTISGGFANFSSQLFNFTQGVEYCILCDKNGASRNLRYATSGFPTTATYLEFTKGCNKEGAFACNDDPTVWETIYIKNITSVAVISNPPVLSNENYTNANIVAGENRTTWRGNRNNTINITTDAFSMTWDIDTGAECAFNLNFDGNFSEAIAYNPDSLLPASDAITSPNETIPVGNNLGCVSCNNTDGNVEEASGVCSAKYNFTARETITIELLDVYAKDSSSNRIDNFNSSNLEQIETMEINFSVFTSFSDVSDFILNFTANGSEGCSLGNLQDTQCYSIDNSSFTWIEFINGTNSSTFDSTNSVAGDVLVPTTTKSATNNWTISFLIDEHYNPNVFKHYGALYDFSDIKFQDGNQQRITRNNRICIDLVSTNIPLDADQYKLDFRVNHTIGIQTPTEPLEAYMSNQSCAVADTGNLVALKLPSELQDDGTKFRGIFTKTFVDNLGEIKSVRLLHQEANQNKNYFIKTYLAQASPYTTNWFYSTNSGATYTNLGDGYETELNINWFYNAGTFTNIVFNLWINSSLGTSESFQTNVGWDINPDQNYPPIASITSPQDDENITLPINITFSVIDANLNDGLNVSLFLFKGGVLNQTFFTDRDRNDTSFEWVNETLLGYFNLTLLACETNTSDLFCSNDTHSVLVQREIGLNKNTVVDQEVWAFNVSRIVWINFSFTYPGNFSYILNETEVEPINQSSYNYSWNFTPDCNGNIVYQNDVVSLSTDAISKYTLWGSWEDTYSNATNLSLVQTDFLKHVTSGTSYFFSMFLDVDNQTVSWSSQNSSNHSDVSGDFRINMTFGGVCD